MYFLNWMNSVFRHFFGCLLISFLKMVLATLFGWNRENRAYIYISSSCHTLYANPCPQHVRAHTHTHTHIHTHTHADTHSKHVMYLKLVEHFYYIKEGYWDIGEKHCFSARDNNLYVPFHYVSSKCICTNKFIYIHNTRGVSLVARSVKNLPAMQETWVWSLSWEDPQEKEMATHFSPLVWKIPWIEEPGGL